MEKGTTLPKARETPGGIRLGTPMATPCPTKNPQTTLAINVVTKVASRFPELRQAAPKLSVVLAVTALSERSKKLTTVVYTYETKPTRPPPGRLWPRVLVKRPVAAVV